MSGVLAAVNGSVVSDVVLQTAASLAALLGEPVNAFHVSDEFDGEARLTARRHHLALSVVAGDPDAEVIRRFGASDLTMGVIGARGAPGGARPAGHLACQVMESIRVPLVVVPPVVARPLEVPGPVVVPLDGTVESADAVRPVIDALAGAGLDLVVVHAFDAASIPAFWDQPAHEAAEWSDEFRRRFLGRVPAPVDLQVGDPGQRIVHATADHGGVLMVLGWASNLSPGHAATVRRVLADATVPILLVPSARATSPLAG